MRRYHHAKEEIDKVQLLSVRMALDDPRREDDRRQEPSPAEQREVERDASTLTLVEQRHALVAQRDLEGSIHDAENVRSRVDRLDHGMRERSGARGGRDILE